MTGFIYNIQVKKPIDVKLTKEGFEKLQKELEELKAKRPGVVTRLTAAREQGDLSENAGYHAAKDELGYVDSRINEIKLLLRFGDVVESKGAETVGIGNTVIVENGQGQNEFSLVGHFEADPTLGKLSEKSPIGAALIGKKVGEAVEIDVPDGKITFKIVEIR